MHEMPGLRLVLALATHILETASLEIVVISMQWCYAARNKVRRSFGITLIDDACLEYAILVAPNAKKELQSVKVLMSVALTCVTIQRATMQHLSMKSSISLRGRVFLYPRRLNKCTSANSYMRVAKLPRLKERLGASENRILLLLYPSLATIQ